MKEKKVIVPNPYKHSLEAVADLKKSTNLSDKYDIFKINSGAMNNRGDYVMKSSKVMAQIVIQMDISGPDHPLQDEECLLVGPTTGCKGYKTLPLCGFIHQ